MAEDDFVLVAGDEWREVQNASVLVNQGGMDNLTLSAAIANHEWNGVREWAEAVEAITSSETVLNARMIDAGVGDIHVWLVVAPTP